jgi:hypothetical protein
MLLGIGCFYVVSIVVILMCFAFQMNPFRESTTSVLLIAFFGSIGLAGCALFLNIAANLSLISEKGSSVNEHEKSGGLRYWALGTAAATGLAIVLVISGHLYSKQRLLQITRAQAESIVSENSAILEKMGLNLKLGDASSKSSVVQAIKFLEGQRKDLPSVTLIYPGKFEDKLAYIKFVGWRTFENNAADEYYECTQNVDCEFFKKAFTSDTIETMEAFNQEGSSYDIYIPVRTSTMQFVLKFSKVQRYGKLGSY